METRGKNMSVRRNSNTKEQAWEIGEWLRCWGQREEFTGVAGQA